MKMLSRMSDLDKFSARAEAAEKEIEKLAQELEALKKAGSSKREAGVEDDEDIPEELKKLRQENNRLKYRLNILKRAVKSEGSAVNENCVTNISQSLIGYFTQVAINVCDCNKIKKIKYNCIVPLSPERVKVKGPYFIAS